jgi:hypothetical protein
MKAYLKCREDTFAFNVELTEKPMSYMDTATQSSYNSMAAKFQSMVNQAEETKSEEVAPLEITNGALTKEGLITVVREMAA